MDFHQYLNEIETYNHYTKRWLLYYNINVSISNKYNWTIQDIPDVNDLNRIKGDINNIMLTLSQTLLGISWQVNQVFNKQKAQEIEEKLSYYLNYLGNRQQRYVICGLGICGTGKVVKV